MATVTATATGEDEILYLAPRSAPTRDNSCLDVCTGRGSTISGLQSFVFTVNS